MDCVNLIKFLSQTCEFLVFGSFKQLFNLICLCFFINLGFKVFYFGFCFTGVFDVSRKPMKKTGACLVKKPEFKLKKSSIMSNSGFGDNIDGKKDGEFCNVLGKNGACLLETVKKSEPKLKKRNSLLNGGFSDNIDGKNDDILKNTGSCSLETVKNSEPKLKKMNSVKNGGLVDNSNDQKDGELSTISEKIGPCLVKRSELNLKKLDIVSNRSFGDDFDDKKDGELCNVDEVFDVLSLRKIVKKERMKAKAAHKELEKERVAAATAADETMAMILRVQKEKSLVEMEFNQYRRLVEEKQIHDQEVIESLRWMVMKHESERSNLEDQLRFYKRRLKNLSKDDDRDVWEENKENDGRVRFFDSGNLEGSPWNGLISSLDFDLTTP